MEELPRKSPGRRRATRRATESDAEVRRRARKRVRWIAGLGSAALVVASLGAFFPVRVCDQQVSNKGDVVRVCRHMQASDPPVIAVAVALLAVLSVFFNEISGFGFTMKRVVEEVSEKVDAVQERTEEVHTASVGNTERITETRSDLAALGQKVVSTPHVEVVQPSMEVGNPALRALAEDYNNIRLTMKSGSLRTSAMGDVVRKMQGVLASDADDFDVQASLRSANGGLRLAAYAHLAQTAEPQWTTELVMSLIDIEDKPFGQYWALRGLIKQCASDPAALNRQARRRLTDELRPRLSPGSDRAVLLREVLEKCSQSD
jgi:hypothetical protein